MNALNALLRNGFLRTTANSPNQINEGMQNQQKYRNEEKL